MKSTRGSTGREAQGTLAAMEDGDGIEAEGAGTKENETNRRHNKIRDETSDCYLDSSPTPESKMQEVIVRKRAGDRELLSFLRAAESAADSALIPNENKPSIGLTCPNSCLNRPLTCANIARLGSCKKRVKGRVRVQPYIRSVNDR
jgi:hypothetical protein